MYSANTAWIGNRANSHRRASHQYCRIFLLAMNEHGSTPTHAKRNPTTRPSDHSASDEHREQAARQEERKFYFHWSQQRSAMQTSICYSLFWQLKQCQIYDSVEDFRHFPCEIRFFGRSFPSNPLHSIIKIAFLHPFVLPNMAGGICES